MQVLDELKSERAFDKTYSKAATVTEDPELAHSRKRRQGQQDQRQVYKTLYDSIHDNIRAQVTQRFQHLDRLHFMELLDFEKLDSFKTEFPAQALANFSETYGHLFDEVKLKVELQHFYSDAEIHSSQKLCDTISFMKSNSLDEAMPELYRLMCLIATIDGANAQVQSLPQTNVVVSVELGKDVTLSCSYQTEMTMHFSWYKHIWGQKPRLISTIYKYDTQAIFHHEFKNNHRFTVERDEGINHLRISEVQSEDAATYYCGSAHSNVIEFDMGIELIVKGAEAKGFVVQQNSTSQLVKPGANVTLQCTIHPMGESCAGQHHVYWFRQNSEQSYPGIIYTYENSSDQCERSCVYKLSKRNIGLSDAGTYYCAVVTCGRILVGNGTRVDIRDSCHSQMTVLTLMSITRIGFLLFILISLGVLHQIQM
ncbi:uncharacterized protein LOC115816208 [Chanos chanos]|uniref:Uncharacterized protein LOC115816208 n=1 Tax=Chanos chanos TaxID=29144 RepID=A0A6J2VV23_CHACN|nr:uncharacterized protein LOC115816208 [Chanos chanos]